MKERWNLCIERIGEIQSETSLQTKWGSYFREVASFVLNVAALCDVTDEDFETEPEKRRKEPLFSKRHQKIWNEKTIEGLYNGLRENNYVNSYLNPDYAVEKFGKRMGQLLSFVYVEMYALPVYAAEADLFEILIRMEWFVELYCICTQEDDTTEGIEQSVWECCYYFISDYYDVETEKRVGEKVDPSYDFAYRLIMEADLSSPEYLYRYGEYISENEIETVRLLNEMPYEELKKMADTYTEGYRIGFVKGNKDLEEGENTITIIVEAEAGNTKTYTVKVTKTLNEEAMNTRLKSLIVQGFNIYPSFQNNIYNYNLNINEEISQLEISAETENEKATFVIEGNENLEEGDNLIKIIVTAEDGVTTNEYKINVFINSNVVKAQVESKLPALILLDVLGVTAIILTGILIKKKRN